MGWSLGQHSLLETGVNRRKYQGSNLFISFYSKYVFVEVFQTPHKVGFGTNIQFPLDLVHIIPSCV